MVGADVMLLHQDLHQAIERILEAEVRVSGVKDTVAYMKKTIL